MASTRSRSPLELPPRSTQPPEPPLQMTRMPISFGVLLLSLGVTWLLCLTLNGVLYRGAAARGKELRRASEQRLDRDVAQLRAAVAALQAQLDLRTQDLAEQTRELERMSTALESVRNARMRRDKR